MNNLWTFWSWISTTYKCRETQWLLLSWVLISISVRTIKKQSHRSLWLYNPMSHVNIRLRARPPAVCLSAQTVCHACAMAPSCFSLYVRQSCSAWLVFLRCWDVSVNESFMKETHWKSSFWGQQEPGEAVHAPSKPRGVRGQLFSWPAFLPPSWFLSSCHDDGCDKSKALNIPTKHRISSQTSASSPASLWNGAWRKRQTRIVET